MIRAVPVLILLGALPCVSVAQSQSASLDYLEEVVVTAEFRDTSIAGLPASASVIRPNEDGTVVQHLEEVLARAPNVNFASGASRGRYIQIRGIGERGQFSEPLNSSVGLIVDGVDLSGAGAAATLFDVAQVEVLRGPQGTLYGANALAGLINIVTNDPTPEHSVSLRLDAGDYDTRGIGGVIAGPLGPNAGYRVAVQRYTDDGFMENDFQRKDDTSDRDEQTYRAKFVWRGENVRWRLSLGHVDVDNGYDAFSLDNDRTTLSDEPGHDRQDTDYGSIGIALDASSRVAFEASLGVVSSDIDYGYDEDWSFTGFHPIGYTSTDRYRRERDTLNVDARFISKPGQGLANGTWDWLAGIYTLRDQVDLVRDYTYLAAPFESEYEVERLAIYAEISRAIAQRWRLTVGARFEQHKSDYDSVEVNIRPEDDLFGGRVLLERDFDDGALVYAGVTQGYKSGGFNIGGSLEGNLADLREYDPETLWNVELGYKTRTYDERLSLRAAVFRMQRRDIQISTSTERPIPNSPAVEFIVYTGNAAEGFNQGLELEAELAVSERLSLFANVGWLDSEYEDYIDSSGRDLDGREQAHAPSYQFFAGAEYAFNERLSARVEVEGKDEYFFSDSHSAKSQSYELINASIAYRAEHWGVRLWGRNLGDEDYFVRGFQFGNDPRDFYTSRPFTQLGEPRLVGVSVEASW